MEKKEAIYRIALAGLLHDIGKFAQRANWMKRRAPRFRRGVRPAVCP